MEENKKDNNQSAPQDSNIEGRLYNSKNPEFKNEDSIDDISNVDQQEGNMNRGTTGGSSTTDNNNEGNKNK